MRRTRFLLGLAVALAVAGCARQQQTYYVIDPQTGQPVPAVAQPAYGQPQYAQHPYARQPYAQQAYQAPAPQPQTVQNDNRGLFSSSPAYAQQIYEQRPAVQPTYQAPASQPSSAPSTERGLFNTRGFFSGRKSAPDYAQQPAYAPQPSVPQYEPSRPQYAPASQRAAPAPQYTGSIGGPYVAAPAPVAARPAPAPAYAYAVAPAAYQPAYTLDSGDKLRIVVFGQEGITSTYIVGADGHVNLPLVGSVSARGFTTQQLSRMIAERLKQGYVREPHVSVEVEVYRPFFILGEVTTPGQYPYVANMTAETAVAIAGGFSPRAYKWDVILTHNAPGQQFRGPVPLNYPVQPGDTVLVKERWF